MGTLNNMPLIIRLKNHMTRFKSFIKLTSGKLDAISCEKQLPIEQQIGLIDVLEKAKFINSMTSFYSPESQIRTKGKWFYFMAFNQIFRMIRFATYIQCWSNINYDLIINTNTNG